MKTAGHCLEKVEAAIDAFSASKVKICSTACNSRYNNPVVFLTFSP